ncbi:hypothetical protein GCM10010466_39410 [Planomonospora alba]|uniref:Uncharacterized protein n=1 Tax=Planomonospora alba TaxID=161354 RepID=A0ABP6ND80_9ACTN
MPHIDREDHRVMERARDLLTQHSPTLIEALRVYAEYMDGAATEARTAHEAGVETSLVTNNGFRQMSELFNHNRDKARAAAEAIVSWKDDE